MFSNMQPEGIEDAITNDDAIDEQERIVQEISLDFLDIEEQYQMMSKVLQNAQTQLKILKEKRGF